MPTCDIWPLFLPFSKFSYWPGIFGASLYTPLRISYRFGALPWHYAPQDSFFHFSIPCSSLKKKLILCECYCMRLRKCRRIPSLGSWEGHQLCWTVGVQPWCSSSRELRNLSTIPYNSSGPFMSISMRLQASQNCSNGTVLLRPGAFCAFDLAMKALFREVVSVIHVFLGPFSENSEINLS